MIKIILISIISFLIGYEVRGITRKYKTKKRNKKVKPLSKQNFKKAMKDLEIK